MASGAGTSLRLQSLARRAIERLRRSSNFSTSASYWEDRYRQGGNSGSGSYNRLAEFKAEVLNKFVADNDIDSVIEFGSGDGAQLELARYPRYVGVDVSETIIAFTRKKFENDASMSFLLTSEVTKDDRAQLALSLDVIYHLVEDAVYDQYMHRLFDAAERFVIVYSSNEDRECPDPHVRHRNFTRWVEIFKPEFEMIDTIGNPYPYSSANPDNTTFADFYIFVRR